MNIRLPLQIENGMIATDQKMKQSINKHIDVLLSTAKGTVTCDHEYGFEFSALRFENFNENEGTVFTKDSNPDNVYQKKVSGSSKNLLTFAAEFNNQLNKYEPRLENTNVAMTYIREERLIVITIRGTVKEINIPYQYKTTIKVWSL